MKTPAGFECEYFYGDYYRGREHEECRLIGQASPPNHWKPKYCSTCPVPGYLRANSCKHIEYKASIDRRIFGLIENLNITAYCHKSKTEVKEPEVGCGQCHPMPQIFIADE